jgi:hypothetical protein
MTRTDETQVQAGPSISGGVPSTTGGASTVPEALLGQGKR